MAMVYLADDLRLERKVAVKVMHEHLAEDENFTRRFDREARSAARLSHANLVNVFDQGHDLGRSFLVMEYLPSITLRELLKKQKRLTLEQSLEISDAILAGLSAAHSAGIVHRDLKPENVLLVDDGRIKIGDFGLARAVSANTTTGQALLGTIAYLSPELVTRGIADERSDLYAFGIMLFEMLTGTQPFTGEQPMQIAYQHANSDVPAPSERPSESTPTIDAFVRWLTQRDPDLRPANAGEALEALDEIRVDPYAPLSGARGGAPAPTETRVLPALMDDATVAVSTGVHESTLTPSTSVLEPLQSQALGGSAARAAGHGPAETAVDRVRSRGAKRSRKGRIAAGVLALLVVAAGGIGFSFGQGPWSQVTVVDVAGEEMNAAQLALEDLGLVVSRTTCSSLTVAAGLAAETTPAAGTRVDRGTSVSVCESTGPEMLQVPTLVGLTLDDATTAISDARFTFGEVVDTKFSDAAEGIVIGALTADDEQLGETFPEQGVINLVVSAGQIPSVAGMSPGNAKSALGDRGLTVDEAQNVEEHSDDIAKGDVIGVVLLTDPVRPGDTVALRISLGKPLVAVPDVRGMNLRDAMNTLTSAELSPTTAFPEIMWDLAEVDKDTQPGAGEMVEVGTQVRVRATL